MLRASTNAMNRKIIKPYSAKKKRRRHSKVHGVVVVVVIIQREGIIIAQSSGVRKGLLNADTCTLQGRASQALFPSRQPQQLKGGWGPGQEKLDASIIFLVTLFLDNDISSYNSADRLPTACALPSITRLKFNQASSYRRVKSACCVPQPQQNPSTGWYVGLHTCLGRVPADAVEHEENHTSEHSVRLPANARVRETFMNCTSISYHPACHRTKS